MEPVTASRLPAQPMEAIRIVLMLAEQVGQGGSGIEGALEATDQR